jgi:putative redox protein
MSNITVRHVDGDRFAIETRDHVLTVDQPLAAGGDDTAPTPTELFVASLASCVAFYARRYLARHDLPTTGLRVIAAYDMAQRPARVGSVSLDITLPEGVPGDQRDRLLAVASHCTVHNSLTTPPRVMIAVAGAPVPAV